MAITPSGGTSPYSYAWQIIAITKTVSGSDSLNDRTVTANSPTSDTTSFACDQVGENEVITATALCTVSDDNGAIAQIADRVTRNAVRAVQAAITSFDLPDVSPDPEDEAAKAAAAARLEKWAAASSAPSPVQAITLAYQVLKEDRAAGRLDESGLTLLARVSKQVELGRFADLQTEAAAEFAAIVEA